MQNQVFIHELIHILNIFVAIKSQILSTDDHDKSILCHNHQVDKITLRAESFAVRMFRETEKLQNWADLSFAIFTF